MQLPDALAFYTEYIVIALRGQRGQRTRVHWTCRTGQIFEQSRSSEETDRNVDVSTAKVFVSTMLKKVVSDWPNIYSNLVTL